MEKPSCGVEKKPLLILTGPTAVGKTALSLRLARAIDGEIVSADSVQVYRRMNIGSAKIRPDEMQGVPHHLIDICEPTEEFNVVRFQTEAKRCLEEIWSRGRIPILTGGTGFYIQAVLYDIDFTETNSETPYRAELEERARTEGCEVLHQELAQLDPEAARAIHPNNKKRVIRALEYAKETGEKISQHNEREREKQSPYRFAYLVLNRPRAELYERINQRVLQMMEEGLLDEVTRLKEEGLGRDRVSMQALGYKELLAYLEGELSLEEAVATIQKETRHFAKRQITWFKREREVIWLNREDFSDEEALFACVLGHLEEKGLFPSKQDLIQEK